MWNKLLIKLNVRPYAVRRNSKWFSYNYYRNGKVKVTLNNKL